MPCPQQKEVAAYAEALLLGYKLLQQQNGISSNAIIAIQNSIKGIKADFRKTPGTKIMNETTKGVLFVPPSTLEVPDLMQELEAFMHQKDTEKSWDRLVNMAVIHHFFECIHPFTDGNGRTGRVLNVLYLVYKGLLDAGVLYLSRYINQHRQQYYTLLQTVRTENTWEEWVLFMLKGVQETAEKARILIVRMRELLQN